MFKMVSAGQYNQEDSGKPNTVEEGFGLPAKEVGIERMISESKR